MRRSSGCASNYCRRGRRANVSGRDVGSRLKGTIGRMRTENVTQLLQKVGAWRDKEIERLTKLDRPTELISDTAECIFVLAEGCSSVEEIRQKIDSLFSDNSGEGRIMCSSTHKAKGLERHRVWMLADTYRPTGSQEEKNLWYVSGDPGEERIVFGESEDATLRDRLARRVERENEKDLWQKKGR